MNDKVRRLATMAVLVAVLAVCSQLAVPVGNVPITAQTAAVMLIALLLTPKYAALTVAVYILAGGIGLPFFANFKGGFGTLLGPTGGYLYGFVVSAFLISWLAGRRVDWRQKGQKFPWGLSVLACVIGLAFVYLFGAVQLKMLLGLESYAAAFALGGIPYLFFEPIKIAVAVVAAKLLQRRGLTRF